MKVLYLALLLASLCAAAFAEPSQTAVLYVNDKLTPLEPSAQVRDGKAYVPLRAGAEALGYHVQWMAAQNAAQVCDDTGCQMIRKSEGLIVNGSLYLPLRKMAEAFGAKVTWDGPKRAIRVQK